MTRTTLALAAALAAAAGLASGPTRADEAPAAKEVSALGLPIPLDRVARGVFVAPIRYRHEERLNSDFRNDVLDTEHRDLFKLGFGVDATPAEGFRGRLALRLTRSRRSRDYTDAALRKTIYTTDFFGQDQLDVFEAFGELGPFPGVPHVSLRIGRQVLAYGDQRLVGPLEFVQNPRTFDALKLIFAWESFGLDAWWSRLVQFEGVDDHSFNGPIDKTDFFGFYGYWKPIKNLRVEPYYLIKFDDENPVVGERGDVAHHILLHALGARAVWTAPLGFTFGADAIFETGDRGEDRIQAWGLATKAVWRAPEGIRPLWELETEFIHGSGDTDPKDGHAGTLDNFFPTNHMFYGEMDFASWQNIQNLELTARFELFKIPLHDPAPAPKPGAPKPYVWERAAAALHPAAIPVMFETGWHWFWLASAKDAWYNAPLRTVRRDATGRSSRDLGSELDLVLRAGPLSVTYGHFIPGEFIRRTTPATGRVGSADYFAFEVMLSF